MNIQIGNWILNTTIKDSYDAENTDEIGTIYFDFKEGDLYINTGLLPETIQIGLNNVAYVYIETEEYCEILNETYEKFNNAFSQPGWYRFNDDEEKTIDYINESELPTTSNTIFGQEQGTEEDFEAIKDIISNYLIAI